MAGRASAVIDPIHAIEFKPFEKPSSLFKQG